MLIVIVIVVVVFISKGVVRREAARSLGWLDDVASSEPTFLSSSGGVRVIPVGSCSCTVGNQILTCKLVHFVLNDSSGQSLTFC